MIAADIETTAAVLRRHGLRLIAKTNVFTPGWETAIEHQAPAHDIEESAAGTHAAMCCGHGDTFCDAVTSVVKEAQKSGYLPLTQARKPSDDAWEMMGLD